MNKQYKVFIKNFAAGFAVVVMIIVLIESYYSSNKTTENTSNTTKIEEKKTDPNDMSIEEYIKSLNPRVKEVTNSIDNNGYILIKDKLNADHSYNIAVEICPILKNLSKHKDYSKIKKVGIMVMADFTDTYGKTHEAKSLSMDINKEELDKINWSNFDYGNIYKLSSDLWIHPSIKD